MSESVPFVTDKGTALLAAIDAGLLPETEDGHDTGAFEKFWDIYSEKSLRTIEKRLDAANKNTRNLLEMLDKERNQRADDRNYYLASQRRMLFAAFFGFVFGGILTCLLHFL